MVRFITSGRLALAMSGLAVVIALGGTAYAVNTVRSRDIVDGTIRSEDIGTGAVRGIDIKNGTVARADLSVGTLGRTPALMARIASDGTVLVNRGGMGAVTHPAGTGGYGIDAGRDIQNCLFATSSDDEDIGIGVSLSSTTTFSVRTRNDAGRVDAGFDVVLFC